MEVHAAGLWAFIPVAPRDRSFFVWAFFANFILLAFIFA